MTVHAPYCGASISGFTAEMALGKSYPGGDNCAMQIDTKTLDALARRLAQVVPPGLNSLGDELERNLKAVLQSSLKNLDLVTREEFEVQRGVLSRTRERLEQLQSRLAELEEGLSQPPG
jgi:BMFP domain-containing protein YqiC